MRNLRLHLFSHILSSIWMLRLVLLAGVGVRIVVYFQNRSLFLDEANLARNIAERSWGELFSPLAYEQYAPPLFLLLEKLAWLWIGAQESALRCWPLLMGCLALWLLYRLLIYYDGATWPAVVIVWLFAFSPFFIRYATEVKQYSTDMAVAALLIWLCLRFPPSIHLHRLLLWSVLGSLAIWLSMPSVFTLAGIGVYILYQNYKDNRGRQGVITTAILGGSWLLQFGMYYLLILNKDLQQEALTAYHQPYFWPALPLSMEDWQQAAQILQSLLHTLSGFTFWAMLLGGLGIVLGVVDLWQRSRAMLWLLLVPLLSALFASALGFYSFIPRLTLFVMPALGLLLFYGLRWCWERSSGWMQIALLAAWMPVLIVREGYRYYWDRLEHVEMRPLLQELSSSLAPTDLLWIEHSAQPAFHFYTQWYEPPVIDADRYSAFYGSWRQLAGEDLADAPPERLWLVFSHLVSEASLANRERHLKSVEAIYGPARKSFHRTGAATYYFTLPAEDIKN